MNERVQGKSLLLEVCEDSLELVDTHSCCVLTLQPIHLIRLWAVSRSDDRSALSLSLCLYCVHCVDKILHYLNLLYVEQL